MQGKELTETRERLSERLRFYEERIAKVRKALEALDTVEQIDDLLSEPEQLILPASESVAELTPAQIILQVLERKNKACTLGDIISWASKNGKTCDNAHAAYNGFYVAAQRLAKKNRVQIQKKHGKTLYHRVVQPKTSTDCGAES